MSKQVSETVDWSSENSLPFDQILYDALGRKALIFYVDNSSDMEFSGYAYDGLGNVVYAVEALGEHSIEIAYGYDGRGLVEWIAYLLKTHPSLNFGLKKRLS